MARWILAELAEELQGTVPHTGQAAFLALVESESTFGTRLLDIGEHGPDAVIDFFEFLGGFAGYALHGEVENGDFNGPASHLAPLRGEHLIDQVDFGCPAGLFLCIFLGQEVKLGAVLGREQRDLPIGYTRAEGTVRWMGTGFLNRISLSDSKLAGEVKEIGQVSDLSY